MDVYAKNVVEFVTVGVEFCAFLEHAKEKETNDFVPVLQKLLPLLYLKASLVEKPIILDESSDVPTYVTEGDYELVRSEVSGAMGQYDDFFNGEQPSSVSECMADIYQDVKDFLVNYRDGKDEVKNDAIYYCIDNFEQIWGKRLIEAFSALHKVVYEDMPAHKDQDNDLSSND